MNGNGYDFRPERRLPPDYDRRNGRRKRRVSAKHKAVIFIILLIYAALLGAVTHFMFNKPDISGTDTFVEYVTDEFGNRIEVSHEYNQSEGEYNILLLGQDREAMLTDVFMLLNFDVNHGTIKLLQIPRDTYVTSTDGVPVRSNKINELFSDHYGSRVRNGEKTDDAYKGALEDVTELIEKSLCIRVNFSLIMDLDGFRNIVDAIGGVEVNIPQTLEYSDPEQNLYIYIPAGPTVLDGEAAEKFVRFRDNYLQGDLGRVNAQKTFVVAFFNKLKSSLSLTNVGTIASEVFGNVVTDMKLDDAVFFGKSLMSMDLSGMTMQTLPGLLGGRNSSHYVMNRAATLALLNKDFNTYDKDITGGIFDASGMFNNPGDANISSYYYASAEELYDGTVYTGDGVADGGINIPTKKK